MDIRWLQDFLTVAETGNFTRAAEKRNTSQPAFSRRIQSLESWLGVELIDRSAFPARLTAAGERFRDSAGDALQQLLDARSELGGRAEIGSAHVRLGLPYVLGTSRLAHWWPAWSASLRLTCSVTMGNIHDLVTALVSDNIDVLLCHHSALQPVHLDPAQFDRLHVESDVLRPYVSRDLQQRERFVLPGSARRPLPLLMYSAGVYFARLVDLVVETAGVPLAGKRVLESDMADVLRDMALAGFGIAWLPDRTAAAARHEGLVPLGTGKWTMPLAVVAFKARANDRRAAMALWSALDRPRAG